MVGPQGQTAMLLFGVGVSSSSSLQQQQQQGGEKKETQSAPPLSIKFAECGGDG